jgi:hypothetical protein
MSNETQTNETTVDNRSLNAVTPTDISDEELAARGMKRIHAFVRSPSPSSSARRSQKTRQAASKAGLRQLNVVAPEVAHPLIKAAAKQLQSGRSAEETLKHLLAVELKASGRQTVNSPTCSALTPHQQEIARRVASLTGWRRFLARLFRLIPR